MIIKNLFTLLVTHDDISKLDAYNIVELFPDTPSTWPGKSWARKRLERLRKPFLFMELEPNYLLSAVEYDSETGWQVDPQYKAVVRRLLIKE